MHTSSSVAARSASMQQLRNSALVALVLLSAIMYPTIELGCLCAETMMLVWTARGLILWFHSASRSIKLNPLWEGYLFKHNMTKSSGHTQIFVPRPTSLQSAAAQGIICHMAGHAVPWHNCTLSLCVNCDDSTNFKYRVVSTVLI